MYTSYFITKQNQLLDQPIKGYAIDKVKTFEERSYSDSSSNTPTY